MKCFRVQVSFLVSSPAIASLSMAETSAVKIPVFIPADPALWFFMCEATFDLASPKPITESKTKYNYCVSHLPPDAASLVRDIIINPDKTDPYNQLKEHIISRCGETKTQEIRHLLAGEQLGDRKPSELLRVMQRRAESHTIADSLMLELFLQQLPANVQAILASISPLSPQKAAEVADRILEVMPSEVSIVSNSSDVDICTESRLLAELKELRKEITSLRRSRSHSRNRYNQRSRNRSPSATSASHICWYHQQFKSKAKQCVQPCSFQGNAGGQV